MGMASLPCRKIKEIPSKKVAWILRLCTHNKENSNILFIPSTYPTMRRNQKGKWEKINRANNHVYNTLFNSSEMVHENKLFEEVWSTWSTWQDKAWARFSFLTSDVWHLVCENNCKNSLTAEHIFDSGSIFSLSRSHTTVATILEYHYY